MRRPIEHAHAGNHGEYMAQDEADCNEPTGRQEPPDKENKQKQEQKQKHS